MLKKIVIIGPESTGKSTLSQQLARHYATLWCPEYAREYLLQHGMSYSYDDLLTIAKGQLDLEDKYIRQLSGSSIHKDSLEPEIHHLKGKKDSELRTLRSGPYGLNPGLLFIDTNMYVMKVWCEFVFGKCHPFILEQIAERKYDFYLLCNIDLPWAHDELREYPDLEPRQRLYRMYKDLMLNQPVPWAEISGNSEQRLSTAIKAVDSLLKK